MHATDDRGYQDASYTLRALAREGLTPYQLPDKIARQQAIAGTDALRAALNPLRRVTARITRGEGEELVATFPWGVEHKGRLKDVIAVLRECAVDIDDVTFPHKNDDTSPTTGHRIQLYACLKRYNRIGAEGMIERDDYSNTSQLKDLASREQLA